MGQCLSEEDVRDLVRLVNITDEELAQTASDLDIEMTKELAAVVDYSIEDLPRNVNTFESYRQHVASIATEFNQEWGALIPEVSGYEATAITWEGAREELQRALQELDIDGKCEEANLAMAQNGIPLPLAALQRTSEVRGMRQETN